MKRTADRSPERRGDSGLAMIAAVVCMLVVVTLTAVAVQQSVGSLSGYAQGRKLLQTVDAAEAGAQSEISALQHWLSSPTGPLPCQGGSPITGLPSGQGWVVAGPGAADSVVNGASLGYYTLSLATYPSQPSGPPAELPSSAACYNNSIPSPSGTSWYVIVQAKGVTSATTGGSTATGRTLQALLHVQNYSALTTALHRRGNGDGSAGSANRIKLVRFYSSGSTTYTSNASAQAFNVNQIEVPPSTAPSNPAASTASYSGSGPPDPNNVQTTQPSATILNGESWLTAGALSQYAEADSSGSSKACAGLVASPGTIQVGSPTCSPTGSPGATGVTLDLSTIPAVGSVLSSIADVTLETSAISSSASMGAGGSPATGTASFGTLYVRVKTLLGIPVTIPVSVSTSPNQNLMSAVTSAITGDSAVLGPVTSTLVATLNSTLALTSNYQTTVAGVLTVSAVHISVLGNAATGDIAMSKVGPNTITTTPPPTTVPSTTTTIPTPPTTIPAPTTTLPPPNTVSIVWIRQVA